MTAPLAPTTDPRDDAKYWHGVLAKAAPLSATDAEAAQWADIARARLREAVRGIHEQTQGLNETERRQALDPGWLASLGIGFEQAATFGFGDELAGLIEGTGAALIPGGRGFGEAYRGATEGERLTREGARTSHPAAYWSGEVAGTLPAAIGALWTKAPAVASTLGRAGLRIATGAGKGALLAGTEAAGRTDGNLGERLESAAVAAPFGAAFGAGLPYVPAAARIAANRLVVRPTRAVGRAINEFLESVAGKAPSSPRLPRIPMDLTPAGVPGLRPMNYVRPTADPLDMPTFLRRRATETSRGLLSPIPQTPSDLSRGILSPRSSNLESLIRLSEDEFEKVAAGGLIPKDIIEMVRSVRATPSARGSLP